MEIQNYEVILWAAIEQEKVKVSLLGAGCVAG